MPETKEDIAAQRDALLAENKMLRDRLASTPVGPRVQQAEHTFVLSEGARQELLINGQTNVGGVMRSRTDVRRLLGKDQQNVDLGTAEPPAGLPKVQERSKVRGVDFVYPSVEPGFIDPDLAGTPGINGPAAKA
jgi:hypothetical protein